MIVNDNDVRRPDPRGQRFAGGWTNLHSWIFLAIVALGLIVVGLENRYHYLSPLGLGKAYRIDKFFGSIQEFDPSQGWVVAKLQIGPPQQALSMMEPPGPGFSGCAHEYARLSCVAWRTDRARNCFSS